MAMTLIPWADRASSVAVSVGPGYGKGSYPAWYSPPSWKAASVVMAMTRVASSRKLTFRPG